MERQLFGSHDWHGRWIKIDPPVGWHSSAMHTGKRGLGGLRLGVFDTHNVYMDTEAENQTNTGTDSYTYINRQELSHNCYTPTHPAHTD